MITLRLTGWREGLRTVSLIEAVKEFSTGSLATAKPLVEELLRGGEVTLSFVDEMRCEQFRERAQELGAVIG